jgi:hypothetical protein
MKIQTTTLLLMSGLIALLNVPAPAQEKPTPVAAPEEVKQPESPKTPERSRSQRSPEQKPTAYLGVLTALVSRELRAQFGLADGFGLQVAEVMPDSPAQEAGLKEHDVLLSFEDQKLVNMEQLQALVRSKKKDDVVSLSIISGGQTKQINLKIGERMMAMNPERQRGAMPGFSGVHGGEWGNTEQWRDSAEDFHRRSREYQERVQDWNRGGSRGLMPQPPMFEAPNRKDGDRREERREPRDGEVPRVGTPDGGHKGGEQRFEYRESHENANVTRSDDTGIYSLRRNDGNQVFKAKPKEGEEKSWPVNNDQERAVVPEPYASKLREIEQIRSNMRDEQGSSGNGDSRPEAPREGKENPSQAKESPPEAKHPEGL